MSNKTISINPSLFSLNGSKTRKQKDKKTKPASIQIISPNVLKKKLLNRIKEHKQKETKPLDKKIVPNIATNITSSISEFNDEFNDSINYLQSLSKHKRLNEEKQMLETQKIKQKEELERKTIRNYHSMMTEPSTQPPTVRVDFPDELFQVDVQPLSTPSVTTVDVPYGVLKGGVKPSYREWSKTQRSNVVTNPNASLIISDNKLATERTARENRLTMLKEKLKQKELVNQVTIDVNMEAKQPALDKHQTMEVTQPVDADVHGTVVATKHITKKTTKKKYTLGRSIAKRKVSVLIKDRGTRKKILMAQKELKRRNINDIKEYLRDHNLVKVGSNAPNDVLRKIYESAMLSGEITNSNSDTLMSNFMKQDKLL